MGRKGNGAPRGLPTGNPSGSVAGDVYHVLRGIEAPDGTTFAPGDVVTAADLGECLEHWSRRGAVATPEELERIAAGNAMLAAVDEELGSLDDFTDEELAELLGDDEPSGNPGEFNDTAVDAPEGIDA